MKCGCKFIRDNEKFLNANLKALENKLAFSKEHGSFVEVKGKNELIASNKSQIKGYFKLLKPVFVFIFYK